MDMNRDHNSSRKPRETRKLAKFWAVQWRGVQREGVRRREVPFFFLLFSFCVSFGCVSFCFLFSFPCSVFLGPKQFWAESGKNSGPQAVWATSSRFLWWCLCNILGRTFRRHCAACCTQPLLTLVRGTVLQTGLEPGHIPREDPKEKKWQLAAGNETKSEILGGLAEGEGSDKVSSRKKPQIEWRQIEPKRWVKPSFGTSPKVSGQARVTLSNDTSKEFATTPDTPPQRSRERTTSPPRR